VTLPKRHASAAPRAARGFRWLLDARVTRPLLSKGRWNDTGVSAFFVGRGVAATLPLALYDARVPTARSRET
jgi:hypothetical protein